MNKNTFAAVRAALVAFLLPFALLVALTLAHMPMASLISSVAALVVMLPAIRKACPTQTLALDKAKVGSVMRDLRPMLVGYAAIAITFTAVRVFSGATSIVALVAAIAVESVRQVVVGVYEETMFRGIVMHRALEGTRNEKTALVLTSTLFALAHVPTFLVGRNAPLTVIPRLAALFVFGLALGLERLRQDNLMAGAAFHTATNLLLVSTSLAATADVTGVGGVGMAVASLIEIATLARPTIRLWKEAFGDKTSEATQA